MSIPPYSSILAILRTNAQKFSGKPVFSYKKEGAWTVLAYDQFYERVLMAARGLGKAGVKPGDRVIILSENRVGWAIADFAIQAARAIPVPIYATSIPEQIEYVINHSEAKIVFVSTRQQYEKLLKVRDRLPGVELVVSFERFLGDLTLPVYTLYQLSEISHPLTLEERRAIETEIDKIRHEDLITIIYTSGTTGVPKGVMLTQHNMLSNAVYGFRKLGRMEAGDIFLSFLPLCHVLERTAGYHAPLIYGGHIAFAESVDKVVENIIEVRPTAMVSVPRLFEKIYSRIYENAHQLSPIKRKLFHWAVGVGKEYVNRRYVDKKPLGIIHLKHRLADRLVFNKIRQRFGGRLRFFLSGGAPLDKTINEFMWIIGIPTFEGYGLTETSPAIALNRIDQVRFGAVGTVLEETEVRLAEDGELLVRGPQVMRGYFKNPQGTAEVLDSGWLATGDIARIDEDGFIFIVDRKKEIIVTAGGKNIAPQPIENDLKLDKYISQALVFGDRKPYLVALLTPNLERLVEFAQKENFNYFDVEDLVSNERVLALFKERVQLVNDRLPSYETIKKIALLPWDFSIDGGELTPTLKLRRKVIIEKYQDRIEALYEESDRACSPPESLRYGGKK
jgi:long-chain acyl-CoA synthetase